MNLFYHHVTSQTFTPCQDIFTYPNFKELDGYHYVCQTVCGKNTSVLGLIPEFTLKKTTLHSVHKSGNIPWAQTHSAWTLSTATECFLPQNIAVENVYAE